MGFAGIVFAFLPRRVEELTRPLPDSKTLTAERREVLLDVMIANGDKIKWSTTVMSPHDLSRGMLKRTPYNLCAFLVASRVG